MSVAVFCSSYYAHSQVKIKSELDYYPTEALLKSYLDHHPQATAILIYDDVKTKADYVGMYEVEKLIKMPVNTGKYTALKSTIVEHIGLLGINVLNKERASSGLTKSTCLEIMQENNSNLLIEVSVDRSFVEIAPNDQSFKTLSFSDIKGFKHGLSIQLKIYFKYRLENDDISFNNTYYNICLTPPITSDEEGGGVSALLGAAVGVLSNIVVDPHQTCATSSCLYMDTVSFMGTNNEKMAVIDEYLSSRAIRYTNSSLQLLRTGLQVKYTNINNSFESQIRGSIIEVAPDQKTAMIKLTERKYAEQKGLLNKLASKFLRYSLVVKVRGDDKLTPWVEEKEYIRHVGSANPKTKERISDYKGKAKLNKLTSGLKNEDFGKIVLVDHNQPNDYDWVSTIAYPLKDVQLYEFTDYLTDRSVDEYIEEQKRINIELAKEHTYRLMHLAKPYPFPAYAYYKEETPLLFPTTVVVECPPLKGVLKKEKKSLIARIKRVESSGAKIGVVFALQESYVEEENPNRKINGQPLVEKTKWKKLDDSFCVLGNSMVDQLNEKFGTTVFELINIKSIPTKEKGVNKFENTQYSVVAFYKISAVSRVDGTKKLTSLISFFEFYEKGWIHLNGGLLYKGGIVLGTVNITDNEEYDNYIEDLKKKEEEGIVSAVNRAKKYYTKKVK